MAIKQTVANPKTGFLLTNRSTSGLMYEASGAKSIWEPSVVSSIAPKIEGDDAKPKSETSKRPYFKK